jgi:LysR family transcriptional activator of nhaA
MTINFNHLRYFWYVAKEQHLTRAAEKLILSQSALSLQIKTLEHQIRHPLFERVGKRLELTKVGQIVFDYCNDFFSAGEELLYQLQHRIDISHPTLRLGATVNLSRNFQIDFIRKLIAGNNSSLLLVSGNLEELLNRLQRHQLDVVMSNSIAESYEKDPFVFHRVADQNVALIAHPRFLQENRSFEELLKSTPLLVPEPSGHLRRQIDSYLERHKINPNIVAQVSDATMLRLLAREGMGIALIPPIVVKDEIENGSLLMVKELAEIQEHFYAITLKQSKQGIINQVLENFDFR